MLKLCVNARDAMPDGGKITIETANRWTERRAASDRDLAPGQYVAMTVLDNRPCASVNVPKKLIANEPAMLMPIVPEGRDRLSGSAEAMDCSPQKV